MKTIHDIDFSDLYLQHKALAARPASSAAQWDLKAQSIEVGHLETPYVRGLLDLMVLNPTDTLLDVGCGAGSIAVLAAPMVHQVYALDFSAAMLDKCLANAKHYKAHNLSTLCKDWAEDWHEVPICDVVVASRSTLVEDMKMALLKLTQQAKRHVYLTYPAHAAFATRSEVDPHRNPELATPSYLYIIAILHQLGIRAQLRFLSSRTGLSTTGDQADWAVIDWVVTA